MLLMFICYENKSILLMTTGWTVDLFSENGAQLYFNITVLYESEM